MRSIFHRLLLYRNCRRAAGLAGKSAFFPRSQCVIPRRRNRREPVAPRIDPDSPPTRTRTWRRLAIFGDWPLSDPISVTQKKLGREFLNRRRRLAIPPRGTRRSSKCRQFVRPLSTKNGHSAQNAVSAIARSQDHGSCGDLDELSKSGTFWHFLALFRGGFAESRSQFPASTSGFAVYPTRGRMRDSLARPIPAAGDRED